jgi:hypothetical protein
MLQQGYVCSIHQEEISSRRCQRARKMRSIDEENDGEPLLPELEHGEPMKNNNRCILQLHMFLKQIKGVSCTVAT